MMKREEYIQKVTALIKNKAARNDVKKELEAHIDDRTQIGSSIEELYEVADFSNFMLYPMRQTGDETYIEIRIAVENGGKYWDEYWLEYTNGEPVSSTAQK